MSKQEADGNEVTLQYECNSCEKVTHLQVVLSPDALLEPGCMAFPDDGQFYCPHCGVHHDLSEIKNDLEVVYWEKLKQPRSKRRDS